MNVINNAAIKQKILRFIITQLFLTLISLPILIAWGLPISALSPLGNLIFAPLLILFLLTASLLFFCELLYLPHTGLVWFLESITYLWQKLLHTEHGKLLYAFTTPPLWLLLSIPVAAMLALRLKQTAHPLRSISILSILFIISIVLLQANNQPPRWYKSIPCNSGVLTLIHDQGKTILIDPGFIGQRLSAQSWVNYTLIPEITKQIGSLTIDHLIILQPGAILFEALKSLCTKMTVKNIYLVPWEGIIPFAAWKNYKILKEHAQQSKIKLWYPNKPITVELSPATSIEINPLPHQLTYNCAHYYDTAVTAQIDNESFTLYAAQHTPRLSSK